MNDIRVQAIILSNDGVEAPSGPAHSPGTTWAQYVDRPAREANDFYEARGVEFRLRFDPETDVARRRSTKLNRLRPNRGKDGSGDPIVAKDPNGNDDNPNAVARQAEARKYFRYDIDADHA